MTISLKDCSNEHLLNVLKNTPVRPYAPTQSQIGEYYRIQEIVNIAECRRRALRSAVTDCAEAHFYIKAMWDEIKRICAYPPIGFKEKHCVFLHSYA